MSEYQTIQIDRDGPVATLTLNRPDHINAVDSTMRKELIAGTAELNADDTVRVVVLTGAGRAFCAGADLMEMGGVETGQQVEEILVSEYKPAIAAIAGATKPWIAAVNGPCAGIGSGFALACDLVVMAEDAFMYQAFGAIGLIPDGGATWHLTRILGPKRAYEMIVTGEKVGAQKCLDLGLCNRVVAPDQLLESAAAWAQELAGRSPLAQRYAKASVTFASGHDLLSVIDNEARLQRVCVDSEDAKEGILAFIEKRSANWKGR